MLKFTPKCCVVETFAYLWDMQNETNTPWEVRQIGTQFFVVWDNGIDSDIMTRTYQTQKGAQRLADKMNARV
jgi:hypothetical protein